MSNVASLISAVAVILVLAIIVERNEIADKFINSNNKLRASVAAGILGGIFGIYGNISGAVYHGAIITTRDLGPLFAGFTGGPLGGFIAGIIAGIHRLTLGGATMYACVVATISIGIFSGILFVIFKGICTTRFPDSFLRHSASVCIFV